MVRRAATCLLLVLLALTAATSEDKKPKKNKKEKGVSEFILQAQFVHITMFAGDRATLAATPRESAVLTNLRRRFEMWGRFIVVPTQHEADIVVAVRVGSAVAPAIEGGPGLPRPSGRPTIVVGATSDTFAVFNRSLGLSSSPLWRKSQKGGLEVPELPLFERFKKEVDDSK